MKTVFIILLHLFIHSLLFWSCEDPSIEKFVVAKGGEIPPPEPEPMEEQEPICRLLIFAERIPEFPEGTVALMNFVQNNVQYSNSATHLEGTVFAGFTVNRDGSLSDFHIKRGLHPDLDAEALRVLKLMPKWIPGKENGHPVRILYTIPVKFKLN